MRFMNRKPVPVDPFFKVFEPLDPIGWILFLLAAFVSSGLTAVIVIGHPKIDRRSIDNKLMQVN